MEKPKKQTARKTFPKPNGGLKFSIQDLPHLTPVPGEMDIIQLMKTNETNDKDLSTGKPADDLPLKLDENKTNESNTRPSNGDSSSERILDEGDRISCLASMKKNYSSGLDQSGKLSPVNDHFPIQPCDNPNPTVGSQVTPRIEENHDEGSPLAKKQRLDSPNTTSDPLLFTEVDLKTLDNQSPSEEDFPDLQGSLNIVITTPAPLLNNLNEEPPSLTISNHMSPPTTGPTTTNDDLSNVEAAMAALHGEPLDVVEEVIESDASERNSPSRSDSDYVPKQYCTPRRGKPRNRTSSNATNPSLEKKTKKERPLVNRELASLHSDEGAIKILDYMQGKDPSSRRVPRQETKTETPTPRPPKSTNRPPRRRASNDSLERKHPSKELKKRAEASMVPATSELGLHQDRTFNDWQPIKKSRNGEEVVYVPKKLMNPADASVIVQRRSVSSDSSSEASPQRNKRLKPFVIDSPPPAASLSPIAGGSWVDRLYAGINNNIDDRNTASQNELAKKLKGHSTEIHLRCCGHLLHVILSPLTSTSSLKNSLNNNVLRELTALLKKLKMESEIRVVLITSSEPAFCTGIDLTCLLHENEASRLSAAICAAQLIQDFVLELANCDKILIAGLSGSVIGLGVTMLPYFDMVFASDKATFHLPYGQLGQTFEGGLSATLHTNPVTYRRLITMMYEGSRVTATEANKMGLVDHVLWPATFVQDLISRVVQLTERLSENALLTKAHLRATLRRDLPAVLKEESELLRQTWITDEFQRRARALLDSGDLLV